MSGIGGVGGGSGGGGTGGGSGNGGDMGSKNNKRKKPTTPPPDKTTEELGKVKGNLRGTDGEKKTPRDLGGEKNLNKLFSVGLDEKKAIAQLSKLVYIGALGLGIGIAVFAGAGLITMALGGGVGLGLVGGMALRSALIAGGSILGSGLLGASAEASDGGLGDPGAPDSPMDAIAKLIGNASKQLSPLLLDLDGDGIETTTVENGIFFDHDLDGFDQPQFLVPRKSRVFALYYVPDGIAGIRRMPATGELQGRCVA